jgi:flagellar biosynthesis/type III secretory pathway chaperone
MAPNDKSLERALRGAPKLVIATAVLMEELIRVLAKEVELVHAHKLPEHQVLLKEKQKLATGYRVNMQAISEHPEMLKSLTPEGKAALKDLAARLSDVSNDNAAVLRSAINAVKQLVANVMSMIRNTVMAPTTYKNTAKHYIQPGAYSPTCAPIAVSRSV